MASYIYLLALGKVDSHLLTFGEQCIREAFHLETKISSRKIKIKDAYDSVRNQYHSAKMLKKVIEDPPPDALRIFGLTDVDLFLPIFTFLFGEAQLHGPGALLSTFRLRNSFYGLPENPTLFESRVKKEIVHELGHTFGLVHCFDPVCVMRPSTYVEDVDQKSHEFCDLCRHQVMENIAGA